MLVQTEVTPNPNSIKFLPGKTVSKKGSFEITKKDETENELVKNLLSINGVQGIFLSNDFISINKYDDISWDDISESAPAIVAMITMPLTYSISNGIALAFVAYALIKIFTGKFVTTSPAIWIIAILSVLSFVVA